MIRQSKEGHWRTGEKPDARRSQAEENIFAGLIYCADCGRVYGRRPYTTGTEKRYSYSCEYCRGHNSDGDGYKRRFKESDLYGAVLASIIKEIEACAETRRLIEKARASDPVTLKRRDMEDEARRLQTELDKFPPKSMKVYLDYSDSILSERDYNLIRERYEAENAAHAARLEEIKAEFARYTPEFVDDNLSVTEFEWFMDGKELTRKMLTALVERIQVDGGGNITIRFRYRDEYAPLKAFVMENGGYGHE